MIDKIKKGSIPVGNGTLRVGLPFSDTYYKPTPKFFRKLGDWLLFAGSVTSAIAAVSKNPIVAAVSVICAASAKFLTNCFKDDVAAVKQAVEVVKQAEVDKKDDIKKAGLVKEEIDQLKKAI
jgi:hypothetical protein